MIFNAATQRKLNRVLDLLILKLERDAKLSELADLIAEADRAVAGDAYVWGDPDGSMYGVGQDSEEAEESGRLIGRLEGLREAAELIGLSQDPEKAVTS